jgi:Tol biopolymer transport system component
MVRTEMKNLSPFIQAVLLAGVVVLLAAGVAAAGSIKISGVMPDYGSVQDFEVSPDGLYAVYRAVQETEGAVDLYSVLLPGGQPVRLGNPMPSGGGVANFLISPDSQRVVYLAPTVNPSILDLYSTPITGPATATVRLIEHLFFEQHILTYQISHDSSWVVYISDKEHTGRYELFAVPINGPINATRKISHDIGFDEYGVHDFSISPDSSRVIYRASADRLGPPGLYSTSLTDPAIQIVKINIPAIDGVRHGYQISSDSSRVIYLAAELDEWATELFSVPLEGPASASVKLNIPIKYVNYRAERVFSAEISPDGHLVVYRFMGLDEEANSLFHLYSVPISGPVEENIRLHEPFRPKGGVLEGYAISPDSTRVVFLALDLVIVPAPSLFSAPIRESQSVKLNEINYPMGWVSKLKISPDSQKVTYLLHNSFQGDPEHPAPMLFSIPIDGPSSESVLLSTPFPLHGELLTFEFSPDSKRIVYLANQLVEEAFELFMVPAGGPSAAAVKLNGNLPPGGNVSSFSILPDSSRVVYQADQEAAGRMELFLADNGLTQVRFVHEERSVHASEGEVSLLVILNQASALTVQVSYAVYQNGAEGSPYTSGTLTFLSGETEKEIVITLPENGSWNGDRLLVIELQEAENAVITNPSTATVTVIMEEAWSIYLPLVGR